MRATASPRVARAPPLVLLPGFLATWRTWELALPALARRHDVLALTLAGHAGGAPIEGELSEAALPDAVETTLDDAGIERAHFAGNSLGGFVALQVPARGRAERGVAPAPAGGWNDDSYLATLDLQAALAEQARNLAPYADAIVATPEGRRFAAQLITTNYEHSRTDLLADQLRGVAGCTDAARMI